MTTSTAKNPKQYNPKCQITVSSRSAKKEKTNRTIRSDKGLRTQKLAGGIVLAFSLTAVFFGGEFSAAAIMIPPALAAVFSKEKILDFNIFSR